MSFDWNEYLILAERLAAGDEASKRTAISRAYYCIFNLAYARAQTTAGAYPGGEPTHKWCWTKYQQTPDVSCQNLGTCGLRMKRRREQADYKAVSYPRLDDEVRRTLQEARQFQRDLAALNATYPRP